jgi:hypothetical protein
MATEKRGKYFWGPPGLFFLDSRVESILNLVILRLRLVFSPFKSLTLSF